MLKLAAVGIAGMVLGAAATAGAAGELRVFSLRTDDVAAIADTHIFCHVRSESAAPPYRGPSLECGETKEGIPGSYGIGITDNAVYAGRWDRAGKHIDPEHVAFIRHHHG